MEPKGDKRRLAVILVEEMVGQAPRLPIRVKLHGRSTQPMTQCLLYSEQCPAVK